MKLFARIQTKTGHRVIQINRRNAIRERCLNCSAWNAADVRNCEFTDCALYPYRMGIGKQDPKKRERAIRDYCLWCCVDQPVEVSRCPATDCPLHIFRNTASVRQAKIDSDPSRGQIEHQRRTELA